MLTKLWCWLFGHKNYFKSFHPIYRGYPEDSNYHYIVPTNQCMRCRLRLVQELKPLPLTEEELSFIRKEKYESKN